MRTIALIALLASLAPSVLRAEQYNSGGKVVHTRLAPVVMHRVSPPYRGQHVYAGRYNRR